MNNYSFIIIEGDKMRDKDPEKIQKIFNYFSMVKFGTQDAVSAHITLWIKQTVRRHDCTLV